MPIQRNDWLTQIDQIRLRMLDLRSTSPIDSKKEMILKDLQRLIEIALDQSRYIDSTNEIYLKEAKELSLATKALKQKHK